MKGNLTGPVEGGGAAPCPVRPALLRQAGAELALWWREREALGCRHAQSWLFFPPERPGIHE